ncbi:DoxX family protein [Occultella glacieicola]|uniref:DoxX family protein n=1 Tax=Occultella glacieicola TaxID=2518684 RepID=A0ABY2E7A6_9MICO|nr:DoxX family protein [Occultella glacieicola]TDE96057.1 DoxX family protein [Occultella glacieicola]
MNPLRLLARPLLASVFIVDGLDSIRNADKHAEKLAPYDKPIQALGEKVPQLPTDARTLSRITGAVTVGAGVLLATGKAPRLASAVLAAVTVPVTVVRYPFWSAKGEQRRADTSNFLRNLALVGGLLIAAEDRVGKPSLGWQWRNWREHRSDLADVKADLTRANVKAMKSGVKATTADLRAKIAS